MPFCHDSVHIHVNKQRGFVLGESRFFSFFYKGFFCRTAEYFDYASAQLPWKKAFLSASFLLIFSVCRLRLNISSPQTPSSDIRDQSRPSDFLQSQEKKIHAFHKSLPGSVSDKRSGAFESCPVLPQIHLNQSIMRNS